MENITAKQYLENYSVVTVPTAPKALDFLFCFQFTFQMSLDCLQNRVTAVCQQSKDKW